jgi:hypothetical protein
MFNTIKGKAELSVIQKGKVWDRPMYISEHTASRMKHDHPIEGGINWNEVEPLIQHALQEAQVQKSYLVDALWEVVDDVGPYSSVTYNVVLNLI